MTVTEMMTLIDKYAYHAAVATVAGSAAQRSEEARAQVVNALTEALEAPVVVANEPSPRKAGDAARRAAERDAEIAAWRQEVEKD